MFQFKKKIVKIEIESFELTIYLFGNSSTILVQILALHTFEDR